MKSLMTRLEALEKETAKRKAAQESQQESRQNRLLWDAMAELTADEYEALVSSQVAIIEQPEVEHDDFFDAMLPFWRVLIRQGTWAEVMTGLYPDWTPDKIDDFRAALLAEYPDWSESEAAHELENAPC